ncbi:NF038122 family metalloprotease [bacterium]|nr:NF038122 family metalloprotease [bacterium]
MMRHKLALLTVSTFVLITSSTTAEAGLIFNLNNTGGAEVGTAARTGFQEAADFYSSILSDNVAINLDIGFTTLGSGILGSASSIKDSISYDYFRSAITADATSSSDALFAAGLTSGSNFSVYINGTADNLNGPGSATPYVDDDGGANNSSVWMNTANAKALGLLLDDGSADASISFSDAFTWDYDASDGITSGSYDFVGVAIHEIGHALGFVSGVDILDQNFTTAQGGPYNDDAFTYVAPLDFSRFSSDSQTAGADIDWTADIRNKYFSIDGGSTIYQANAFSTGKTQGDGQQASHWKDSQGYGLFDPTLAAGETGTLSALDTLALDIIGWDLASSTTVPEPSTAIGFGFLGLVSVTFNRRRRRCKTANV